MPFKVKKTALERFESLYVKGAPDECWNWLGYCQPSGHARFTPVYGKPSGAYRFAYKTHVGPIPDGMLVCHSCDNPKCVNPTHLWVGTHADNQNDKMKKGRWRGGYSANSMVHPHQRKTHCPKGHPYAGENLFTENGSRKCKACRREQRQIRRQQGVK